jgi:predicted ATP-grasp superfamily ATP-dependent carboligase
MHGSVLITDGHWNKSVAAIRSMSLAGIDVTVSETSRFAAGMLSRYPKDRFLTPSPISQAEAFIKDILFIIKTEQPDVLLPMELTTLLLISKQRAKIGAGTKFPFAPHKILLKAASKIEATLAAERAGIKPPQSLPITADTSAAAITATLGTSLVLKPDFGEGGRGLCYCEGEEQLSTSLACLPKKTNYLGQRRIAPGGAGIGVSILMDEDQRVLASFCHKRIREYPISGGPSTCREAITHPQAERDAISVLRELKFQGIAMVEFKEDPATKRAVFLEINPRFWGSLPLAIAAGVDFPTLLWKWARGFSFEKPEVKIGTRVRNLLPGDLLHFISQRGCVAKEFWSFSKESDDLLSLRDPLPALGRIISPFLALYDPQLKSVFKKRQ